MAIAEIYSSEPTSVEKAAEYVAACLRDNLRNYNEGKVDYFNAIFPLNIAELDESGIQRGVNDVAHDLFLDMLGIETIDDGSVTYSNGKRLYFEELSQEIDGTVIPYQITYSSQPFESFE